ncbi:MAG: hypothetical protein HRU78_06845 [Gammaproteobacteria bacterium]|nr:MAG: hypothetical protein HRU78_06845 [Gammaproteobacteria bacterium]
MVAKAAMIATKFHATLENNKNILNTFSTADNHHIMPQEAINLRSTAGKRL